MRKQYIVVTPFFPSPDNWRGAYCFDFVRALRREVEKVGAIERSEIAEGLRGQWKVLVFVPGAGEDYEIGGVKVYRFPTRQLPSNILPFLFARHNTRSFLNKVKEVLMSTVDLDLKPRPQTLTSVKVCHAHTANCAIYALAAKRAFGCKTLLHHHDLMSFGLNNGRLKHCGLYNHYLARQLKSMHEQIDCHVFISRLCQRSFETFPNIDWLGDADYSAQARGVKHMAPVRIKRPIILHNGVDTSIFHPKDEVEVEKVGRERMGSSPFVIGCVGNVEREKGQYDLLCAVKILQDAGKKVRCLFVGSGSDKSRCETFAKAHQLDVEFKNEMRHEQLPDFYRQLDLFVLPTWLDGFGCVYTEAYACGVPFIASTNAGVEDMIAGADRNLWLCKQRDPEDLASKILYYIQNRPQQRLKGEIEIGALVKKFVKELVLMEPGEGVEPPSASNEDAALTLS